MRLTTVAVFSAIAVLSILQYRWAVNSGEKIINDLAKSFEFRIFGSLAQEISRIELFTQHPGGRDISDDKEIRTGLTYLGDQFLSEFNGNYILSYAYANLIEKTGYSSTVGGDWVQDASGFMNHPVFKEEHSEPDFRDMSIVIDPEDKGKVYLVRRYPGGKYTSFIHFDLKLFMEKELIPAIDETLGDYTISLVSDLTSDAVPLEERNYRFSPVSTLFNHLAGNDKVYYLTFPFLRLPMTRLTRDSLSRPPADNNSENMYMAISSETGESLFFERELAIAVQWLTGSVLLLGIGAAYILILYQKNRLSRLRRKEKEFVATITHELRTPLTVIHSAADNMQSGILNSEKITRYGELIKEQSGRLSAMIEGILLFSRLEGKAEQPSVTSDVSFRTVQDELELFFNSLQSDGRITLSIDFGSLPAVARTDRETLVLILTNLISNSFHHAYPPDNRGEIRLFAHLRLPSTLVFSVEDDGLGIPRKEQKHIFEPFFRGDRSFREQIKGSGLGLYLVNRKTKQMGGSVKVNSPYLRADGKIRPGTSITVSIPFFESELQE